ncbi:MAG TPA: PKD domain-containing protein, partial [Flavisolibacter sp.]|nr:PKD domain-containing protein [Flavisolibacter sp.]
MKQIYSLLLVLLSGIVCLAQAPTPNFTAAQTSGCAPLVINFQDQSTGSPVSWQWNFGNGSTSTLQNPSTTYFNPGTYTVTLTATNASGSNTLTRTGFITIYAKPAVNFIANDSTGCAPLSVQFSDASTPSAGTANVNWQWDFGNGTGSSAQNPQTAFTTAGNYTISLKVTNDKGCFASFSKTSYIQLTGGLSIDFSTSGPNRCRAPFPVSFTNNSTGPGTLTYLWNFGDGGTSTLQNPSHVYAASGSYNVSLAVTSSNGCTDTVRRTNFVTIQNITTAFTAPDSICVRTPVSFTNTSAPAGVSSFWNFGDATSSTAANPVKAFSTAGTYIVQLLQTFSYCTDSFSKPITILPRPAADFTANNRFQCKPPLPVNFTDASANAVSWRWNFGDGATSTQQNPSHTYTAFGNFDVTLIVTNSLGCTDTMTKPAFIRIQRPVISFPSLPLQGCVPYTTTFSAGIATLDNVTSYLWDFGNGVTSTAATPTHTYLLQGNYTVSLTITTSTGCTESFSLPNAITVGRVPTVDFTASPNPVCTFGTVQFTSIFNEGNAWLWNFGDGTTSTVQNPVHQYTDTLSYNVTLTVTNNGCPVTLTKTSFVKAKPPIAGFSFQKDCINRKRMVFTDISKGATSWLWNFGDGVTSTAQNPSHIYASFGIYTVSLTAMNDTCQTTKTLTLNIFDESPSFTANIRVACKTAAVNFTAISANLANIASYEWDFFNGATSTAQNPQIVYTTSGNYGVQLITTDLYGCKDTTVQSNYIRINGPTARFTIPIDAGCKGFTAPFGNQSQDDGVNPIVTWKWNFGDGTSQTLTNSTPPQHVYPNVGTYIPQLIVTDAAGCKDSTYYSSIVSVTNPQALFNSPDTLTCLGSVVQFANTSTAAGANYSWNFGDGTSATGASPSHIYADTGLYNITLTLVDQFGCRDTLRLNNYINIKKTTASFNVSDSIGGCTPFEVLFTNTSQFYTASSWQLGNGGSTANNPSQVYNTAGTYNIRLTVTGRGGCTDTAVKTLVIYDAAASSFSYNPFNGCKPLVLNGIVNSPAPLDFTWDFGDGSIITTKAGNITHTYNVFGNFIPRLILSDSLNCLIPLTGTDTVKIIGATAKYGWSQKQFCDSGTVFFTDSTTSNDLITSYTWSFGDGGTSSLTSPSHSYLSPGLYTVSLTLQTAQGCRDTLTYNPLIKVVESPSVRITGDTIICKDDFVNYAGVFNRPDTSIVQWAWAFPNSSTSAQQIPPRQQFVTAGSFAVQAIATNTSGCADTATRSLLVNPLPAISIPSPQTTLVGTPILLPATYTNNVIAYNWSPPLTLSCNNCPQPLANPKFNTLYTVTATDSNGCKNTGQVQVIVLCKGANVFVPNTFSPNGDGSNDVFYVRGKGLARVKSLRIFNRWGEVVFERINFGVNDPSVGWDGTYKGKKLSSDTYIYQADVFCDN